MLSIINSLGKVKSEEKLQISTMLYLLKNQKYLSMKRPDINKGFLIKTYLISQFPSDILSR